MTRLRTILRRRIELGAIVVAVLMVVAFAISTNGQWLDPANTSEVLRTSAILAIAAFGMALVIGTGEIDLSVGSVFGVASVLYLALLDQVPVIAAFVITLVAGTAIGALNGWVVSRFDIPSLIVTLGGLFVFRGVAQAIGGTPLRPDDAVQQDPWYGLLGHDSVLGLNTGVWWSLLVVLILSYVLILTPWGNRLLAVGGDTVSAESRGINVRKVRWGAFVASGMLASLAGVLQAGSLDYADSAFGRQLELQAVAAAVIGGCLLAGGRISLLGTIAGALIMSGIQSFLVVKGINPQWFVLLLGLIIILSSLAVRWLHQLALSRSAALT